MRLLTKTSIHYLWVSGIVLALTLSLLFFLLKKNIADEIREQLELQTELVSYEIKEGKHVEFPMVKIELLRGGPREPIAFKDTLIFDPLQQEKEDYYLLRQVKNINGKPYRITLMTAYIGWHEYLKAIIFGFAIITFAMTGGGVLVNYFVNKKLWHPFLKNLLILKSFTFKSNKKIELLASDIDEFKDLNIVLIELMEHASREYHSLQEFTENASHELQTPISVIRSQLEKLSQYPLEPKAAAVLQNAKGTLNRLSKVNKALLLLTKLERDNFPDLQMSSISEILQSLLTEFADIFSDKELDVNTQISQMHILCSPHLVNILLSNLLSNINHHTTYGGKASVVLNKQEIIFSNEGPSLTFPEESLFRRFQKSNVTYKGVGLGLSIVRQICIVHNWKLSYNYIDKMHYFSIRFSAR